MAPKARAIDLPSVQERLTRGESRRDIAKSLGIPESTLRHHLNKGIPHVNRSIPCAMAKEDLPRSGGVHKEYQGTPPLYVHPGIPDSSTEESTPSVDGGEARPQVMPSLSIESIHHVHQEIPQASPSPQLAEALTKVWPELQSMLAWWQERRRQVQEAGEKLERVTYHVAPRWIDAVKREADRTGDSYAAIVNRAFRRYFEGR